MPLLTFSVKKEELLSKRKLDTFRANAPRWKALYGPNGGERRRLLHIWWHNPRSAWRDPEVYKMGIARWTGLYAVLGYGITEGMARRDGFGSREEMLGALAERNGMTAAEVLTHEWANIQFEWAYGPFTKAQSALVCWEALLDMQNQAVAPEQRCPGCGLIGQEAEFASGEKVYAFCSCQVCGRTWG